MNERIIKAFPHTDISQRSITTKYIDRQTGEQVGEFTRKQVDPRIQAEIDKVCKEAADRKKASPIRKALVFLKENSIFS